MLKKSKKTLVVVVIALLVLLVAVMFAGRGFKLFSDPEKQDIAVETPICTLYFPARWQGQVSAIVDQTENVTVSFSGKISDEKEVPLFDVIFGELDTQALGTVKTKEEAVYTVGVFVYEPDPDVVHTDAEIYQFDAMQEDLNYLIERLPLEDRESLAAPKDSVAVVQKKREKVHADVVVDTPYASIVYPGELAGTLYLDIQEEEPYTITFCWNQGSGIVPLYKLSFGGDEGTLMGYLEKTGHPVFLTVFDVLENAELSQEDQVTALSVQESLNEVIANLQLQAEGTPWIELETPYGVLCYPQENQQVLRVETEENGAYTIRFHFVRENGEEAPLFDVTFGGDAGVPVGRYTGSDGAEVPVNLVGYDPAFDESWSTQEQELYYTMAEGVNFLLEKLEEMHPFEFVA